MVRRGLHSGAGRSQPVLAGLGRRLRRRAPLRPALGTVRADSGAAEPLAVQPGSYRIPPLLGRQQSAERAGRLLRLYVDHRHPGQTQRPQRLRPDVRRADHVHHLRPDRHRWTGGLGHGRRRGALAGVCTMDHGRPARHHLLGPLGALSDPPAVGRRQPHRQRQVFIGAREVDLGAVRRAHRTDLLLRRHQERPVFAGAGVAAARSAAVERGALRTTVVGAGHRRRGAHHHYADRAGAGRLPGAQGSARHRAAARLHVPVREHPADADGGDLRAARGHPPGADPGGDRRRHRPAQPRRFRRSGAAGDVAPRRRTRPDVPRPRPPEPDQRHRWPRCRRYGDPGDRRAAALTGRAGRPGVPDRRR